jgi:hypothetical protein
MEQIPRKKSNLPSFLEKKVSVSNSYPMNTMVSLDLGDFFPCKIYGLLRSWSTTVDLGP